MLRAARGWTQAALADRAGVERVTLNQTESGKRTPRALTQQVVAEALEVPVEALQEDVACLREVARLLNVALAPEAARTEGPLVDEARRLAAQLPADRQAAVAQTLRGLVMMQVPASPVPVPSRSAVADEGRRGGRSKDDKSSA